MHVSLFARAPVCLWFSVALLSLQAACLESNKVSKTQPVTIPQPTVPVDVGPELPQSAKEALVSVNLKGLGLTETLEEGLTLSVQVFEVVQNKRGNRVGEGQLFAVTSEQIYPLAPLAPGLYDLRVELYDASHKRRGVGEQRALFAQGNQSLSEILWKDERGEAKFVPVELNIALKLASPQEPQELRQILKTSCVGCHSVRAHKGGLVLENFPYESRDEELSQSGLAGIAAQNASRVASTEAPMPPAPLKPLAADKQTVFAQFAKTLRDSAELSQQPDKLLGDGELILMLTDKTIVRSALVRSGWTYRLESGLSLPSGRSYLYSVLLKKPDGTILLEQKDQTLVVPVQGSTDLNLEIAAPVAAVQPPL